MSELASDKGNTFVKRFLADFGNPQWNNDDDENNKKKRKSLSDYFLEFTSESIVYACVGAYVTHRAHRKNEITITL